ncbi:MAG: TIGR02281 family clan AA aspartic protease [Alphaproteobacteria bacterium]|nr:TIGR02281 family clan AA aspartic protease [Alphaproteobacteria bacterium]
MPLDDRTKGQPSGGSWPRREGQGPDGPGRDGPEQPGSGGGWGKWLVIALVVASLVAIVSSLTSDDADGAGADTAVRLMGILASLALVGMGFLYARTIGLGEALRYVAIWGGIGAVVALAYPLVKPLYGDRFERMAERRAAPSARAALAAGEPTGDGGTRFRSDERGQFVVLATVDGKPIRFLVDTGATVVTLSPEDARRLGMDLKALSFTQSFQTANGVGKGAPVTLGEVTVGGIAVKNVTASVNESAMQVSLLGASFLKRLTSYEVRQGELILRK